MEVYRPQPRSVYMETVYPVFRRVPPAPPCIRFPEFPENSKSDLHYLWLKATNKKNLSFCSMFSLMFLHFFLYGCNVFAWRKARINYSFIFELSPTKELKYRDVFLICTASMTAVMGVMFVHLSLLHTQGYSNAQARVIPGLLLLVMSWSQRILE